MIDTIIFDWKRTLYDPETKQLISGARAVLEDLFKRNVRIVLIGKGGADMDEVLDVLDARKFFANVHFVPAKSDELFEQYVSKQHPETTLVVGDRAQGEIAIGKSLGARCVWVRAGEFSDEVPIAGLDPDETIDSIELLLDSSLLTSV